MEENCRFGSSLASSAILLMSVNISFRAQRLVMSPFSRFVRLLPPSLQWVPWPPVSGALRFPTFVGVGSEVAHRVTQCWPPSAAQTVHADFPHTAFTKLQSSGMPRKELGRSG